MAATALPATEVVDAMLDVLPVTDSAYHALKHTRPVVDEMVREVLRHPPAGPVLVVGYNELLVEALDRLGCQAELWDVGGAVNERLAERADRRGELDSLLDPAGWRGAWALVLLPYVLDACDQHPAHVLASLAGHLLPGGRIVAACRNLGTLETRLRAALGRTTLPDPELDPPRLSMSWPDLLPQRLFDVRRLRAWCDRAGLRIEEVRLITDTAATIPVDRMRIGRWLRAQALHTAKRAWPAFRDCAVVTLAAAPKVATSATPSVSVVVASTAPESADRILGELRRQAAPGLEAILVHRPAPSYAAVLDRDWGFPVIAVEAGEPSSPGAANAALELASGEIIAVTDDQCSLPKGWLEAGAGAVGGRVAAAAGRVITRDSAGGPFFEGLPGHRPSGEDNFYPASSSFYLRAAVTVAGGFDTAFQDRHGARWGWESTLAARLHRLGYRTRYEETLHVFREFEPPRRRDWPAREFRHARDFPGALSRLRVLGHRGAYGLFASRRTLQFDLLLAGIALAAWRRQPLFAALALPWTVGTLDRVSLWPPRDWPHSMRYARALAARHTVWLAGLAVGSLRARRPVL